jgi:uncharacterized protein (TIGR03435 family)
MKQPLLATAVTVLLLCSAAFGQPAAATPVFKNADVHVSTPGGRTQAIGRFRPGARFEANGFTLLDLVVKAYGVSDRDWVVGGPAWLGTDKFDIVAEVPAGVRETAMHSMLQVLLADRFQLVVHDDRRPMRVYALVPGKRLLIKESTGGGESRCSASGSDVTTMVCTNVSMEQFTRELYDSAYGYFDRPLFDKTGLTGRYDLTLHWTPFNRIGDRNADGQGAGNPAFGVRAFGVPAFNAVDTQLGLKVETREQPVPVLVIDHVNRTPTPNAPGVAAALRSPALTEFEVAEVRAHKPQTPFKFATYETEADMLGLNLRNLIGEAYGVRNEELAGEPKWVDTEPFDVIAKAPRRVPWENMQVMLQNLIEERFKLTYHIEDRPITAYALMVGKRTAKLKEADANGRSDCRKGLGDGGTTLTCRNTTMAQFAEKARQLTGDFPPLPVADLTGLTGGFDFAVTWTPSARTNSDDRGGDPIRAAGLAEASTPTGQLTFFEALQKQLGLKLQQRKLPMPVMVIDHVEPPAEH